MDEEDFQVSGQALSLGWSWASGGSFPSVGLDRQKVPQQVPGWEGEMGRSAQKWLLLPVGSSNRGPAPFSMKGS